MENNCIHSNDSIWKIPRRVLEYQRNFKMLDPHWNPPIVKILYEIESYYWFNNGYILSFTSLNYRNTIRTKKRKVATSLLDKPENMASIVQCNFHLVDKIVPPLRKDCLFHQPIRLSEGTSFIICFISGCVMIWKKWRRYTTLQNWKLQSRWR